MSNISEFYTFQSFNKGTLFLSGEDLVFNNRIFKNCLTDEVATIEGYPYEGDNNNLLFFNENAILKDKNTGAPTLIVAEIPPEYSFFVHNNILYRALGGYIVKTRLF